MALKPVENETRGGRADEASNGPDGEDGGKDIVVDGQASRQVEQGGANDGDGAPLHGDTVVC